MPEGPFGFPRFETVGPLSRETKSDIKRQWRQCPTDERPKQICREIKFRALAIISNQDAFPSFKTLADINGGKCHTVARSVARELDYVTRLETIGGDHGWIMYEGQHYDAERPAGVDDPFKLPFFFRIPPQEVLRTSQREAEMMGEELPQTVEDMIVEV